MEMLVKKPANERTNFCTSADTFADSLHSSNRDLCLHLDWIYVAATGEKQILCALDVYGNREMKGRESRGEGKGGAIVREREREREKLALRNRRVLERNCSGCPSPTDGSDAV